MKRLVGSKMRSVISTAFILTILNTVSSCSKSTEYDPSGSEGGPAKDEVWIQGNGFNPSTITVVAGTTIKWTNKHSGGLSVTSDPGDSEVFESGSLVEGETFFHTFITAGRFPYHDALHPMMKATVVVN